MDGTPDGAKSVFFNRKTSYRIGLVGWGALMIGCSSHSVLPYPSYFSAQVVTQTGLIERANAYSDYLSAAQQLDAALGNNRKLLNNSSFSPDQQKIIERAATMPLKKFKVAMQKVCRIPYAPAHSQGATEARAEWRLLVKVLVWRIQDSVSSRHYGLAIDSTVMASKFGFDLAAGLPNDASLGLITVNDARRAIAPALADMSIGQLETLSKAMKTVFLSRPSITLCYDYAEKDSLQQVQEIQDIYRDESYPELEKKFGSASKEIAPILKDLHDQPDRKRAAFFDGFAQDAKDQTEHLKENASLPVASRLAPTTVKPGTERPWRKLSRKLLGIGEPIEKMNDETRAKTQLLILECQVLRTLKMNGRTPVNLNNFSAKLVTDPYSGQPFVYQQDGTDYKLYSVGEDLIDNDGETDESYSRPDMRLERPTQ